MTSPVELGSMLFSITEPNPGFEVDFHRWYERDHFYAGMLAGPGCFSGRRWVATRRHKDVRYPEPSPVSADLRLGSFLHTYFVLAGHHDSFVEWAVDTVHELHAAGRMFAEARQTFTSFYRYHGSLARDPDGVPASLALDHPFAGLVALIVDCSDRDEFERWYGEEHLPELLHGTPVAQTLAFRPLPLPERAPAGTPHGQGGEHPLLFMSFTDVDPLTCWDEVFAPEGDRIAETGLGRVTYAAPFIPTVPGTDRYTDELF